MFQQVLYSTEALRSDVSVADIWRYGAQASLLPCFPGLRRLDLWVGFNEDYEGYKNEEYSVAPIIRGVCASDTISASATYFWHFGTP